MSIFARKDEEAEEATIDEGYKEAIYPRAMQDFVHIEDFKRVVMALMEVIDPTGRQTAGIDIENFIGAKQQLQRYQADLES